MKLHRGFQILPMLSLLLLSGCGQMHASKSLPSVSASPALAAQAADSVGDDSGGSAAFEKDVLEAADGDTASDRPTEVASEPVTALPDACKGAGLSVEMSFTCKLLPVIMKMDLQVFKQRQMVLQLQKQASLSTEQIAWLASLRLQYKLPASASLSEILQHVDIVPIALMISQAALESDWGRSNIAHQSGNLYGRHGVRGKNSCYMVGSICLIKYASLDQMISDQIEYYNTSGATFMQNFRAARARLRTAGKPLDSDILSESLKGYAAIQVSDPDKYPKLIRATLQGAYHIEELAQSEEDVVEV